MSLRYNLILKVLLDTKFFCCDHLIVLGQAYIKARVIFRSRSFKNQIVSALISISKRLVCLRPKAFLLYWSLRVIHRIQATDPRTFALVLICTKKLLPMLYHNIFYITCRLDLFYFIKIKAIQFSTVYHFKFRIVIVFSIEIFT